MSQCLPRLCAAFHPLTPHRQLRPLLLAAPLLALPLTQEVHAQSPADGRLSALDTVAPVTSCSALTETDMRAIGGEGSAITSAEETTSDGMAVCSVAGTLAPAINFQVLLPLESWTQRYLQVGCGGLCGNITLRSGASDGCQVLNDGGFVIAATDMGHTGQEGKWGLNDQQRADFAYRAQHVTSQAARTLINAFYGQPERYSYFNGCSDGGREALMEAMRYPKDFDGVIAGAPAMLFQVQNTLYHGWQAAANTDEQGNVVLTSDKLPVLHQAVIDACDANDGVKDGLISQPARCDFDPASLICDADAPDDASCLSAAQAAVAQKFYDGPRDPKTGAYLTAGQPLYGSELNWQGVYVADDARGELFSKRIVTPVLRYLAFETPRPEAELSDLAFTEATLEALRPRHHLFDATQADLSAFEAAGGRIIMWHGLADPHISPANTLALHDALIEQMGADTVKGFERLYLLPGVSHCSGGEGPSHLDLLTPMMAWVENDHAPEAIMTASASDHSSFGQPEAGGAEDDRTDKEDKAGKKGTGEKGGMPRGERRPPMALQGVTPLPDMTRPVYPYPYVAVYTGHGDITKADNWEKGDRTQVVNLRQWPGSDLFGVYEVTAQ